MQEEIRIQKDTTAKTMPDSTTISYDALNQKIAWTKWGVVTSIALVVSGVVFAISGSIFPVTDTSKAFMTVAGMSIFPLFIASVIGLILAFVSHNRSRKARFEAFLDDNQWTLSVDSSYETVATSILGIGDSPHVHSVVEGVYKGHPMNLSRYTYTTGSGKSRTTHSFVTLRLQTAKSFPHIVLDSQENNFWKFSNLPNRIPGGKTLELEGNFNQKYQVVIEPSTERDALHFLTPDFMDELIDSAEHADIELEHNNLFVLVRADGLDDQILLKRMFAVADVVIEHIGELSDTWQASSSPETIQKITETALRSRTKAFASKRVKTIGVLVFGVYFIVNFWDVFDEASWLLVAFVLVITAFAAYQAVRNHHQGK